MQSNDDSLFDDILGTGDLEIELPKESTDDITDAVTVAVNSTALNERACLSVLHRKDTGMTKAYDEEAQKELRLAYGDSSLSANKRLFRGNGKVRELIRLSDQLYAFHKQSTLDSGTTGKRLLDLTPKAGEHVIAEFSNEMTTRIDRVHTMFANEIAPIWDQLVAADVGVRQEYAMMDPNPTTRQSKLARITADEYPTVEDARKQFTIVWLLEPIANDSAVAALTKPPKAMVDKLTSDITKIVQRAHQGAKRDIGKRMLEPLEKAMDKLRVPIGEKGSIFRDSLLENLTEQLDQIEALNILDDPETNKAIQKAKDVIAKVAPKGEALRTSPDARKKAVNQLDDLAKTFGSL